jgi:cell division protein ZapE
VIWFDFAVLCSVPRSQLDYLELADKFQIFFISGVPALDSRFTSESLLFVHLIDVLYDKGRRLILSAAVPLESLLEKGAMTGPFQRTYSRLEELSADPSHL